MNAIILKKTDEEREIKPWEPRGKELATKYIDQLMSFLESHNNDIEGALGTVKAMVRFRENLTIDTIFERLIPVSRSEEVILRLFRCIFETMIYGREIKIQFI